MDELIAAGIAGLLVLFIAGVLVIYGIASLVIATAGAFAAGEYGSVLFIIAAVLLLLFAYMASGLWLRRTDRI